MRRPAAIAAATVVGSVALLVFGGCAERRDLPATPEPPSRVTYEADIAPIFDQHCVSCHGSSNPASNYALTTYDEVLGNGSDGTPNALPGDPQSLLLLKSLPGGSMNTFYATAAEIDLVVRWVVEDSLVVR
ncbi:MAG TPA: c-type cytochrome domain-containing protein [Candidatus Udaeobacter sp.]|nr:c-type cytochrome domain-containing protein [Candidatus Udaeobacter sp.]